jgi:hypothetical protein
MHSPQQPERIGNALSRKDCRHGGGGYMGGLVFWLFYGLVHDSRCYGTGVGGFSLYLVTCDTAVRMNRVLGKNVVWQWRMKTTLN